MRRQTSRGFRRLRGRCHFMPIATWPDSGLSLRRGDRPGCGSQRSSRASRVEPRCSTSTWGILRIPSFPVEGPPPEPLWGDLTHPGKVEKGVESGAHFLTLRWAGRGWERCEKGTRGDVRLRHDQGPPGGARPPSCLCLPSTSLCLDRGWGRLEFSSHSRPPARWSKGSRLPSWHFPLEKIYKNSPRPQAPEGCPKSTRRCLRNALAMATYLHELLLLIMSSLSSQTDLCMSTVARMLGAAL